jgi:hypothetical protein
MGMQVPSWPSALQASHCPVHAFVQHTPSMQVPEAHSAATLQSVPGIFFGVQTPPAQYSLLLQSPSEVQLSDAPPHRSPRHAEFAGHAFSLGGGQLPAPSQKATRVADPLLHDPSRHCTPGPGYVQLRVTVPSQTPPHCVSLPAQPGRPSAGGCPAGMVVHLPMAPS